MRAAIISASIVAIGLYLFAAAVFAFTPTWIGLGSMAIALVGSLIMVVADRSEAGAVA